MDIGLRPMRPAGSTLRAGSHCSDGWAVATPWHHHDMHQLLYAFEGAVEVEGRHGRYTIPRQFAAWIPACAVHRTTIQTVASGSIFLDASMVSSHEDAPRIIAAPAILREMVMHAMRWPLDRPGDAVSTAYFEAFAALCGEWIADEVKLALPTSDDVRIAAAMAFTERDIATITLADVCRAVSMSERSLRRHFRQAAGISWEDYRLRMRLCLSVDALERTTKPVSHIAAELGYDDPAAFARAFRRGLGMSPSAYRRLKR